MMGMLKALIAFLRSPAQWTLVLCTASVVVFLELFTNWSSRPGPIGAMFFFVQLFVWLCLAIGAGLLLHFGFDKLTDWMARTEEPKSDHKHLPPTAGTIFR